MFRRRRRPLRFLPIALLAVVLLWGGWQAYGWLQSSFGSSREMELQETVDAFYAAEQQGDFGSAWELFHSDMHKRFSKEAYIETRAHVILNHFGVQTFQYAVGEPELVGEWRMDDNASKLAHVYKIQVQTTFQSPIFGRFELSQVCYLAQENEQWRMLWDYQPDRGSS
ncbi:hypothetical protein [Paenibacillus daejeonensis]|uniref:hypothetical protein n=1 Tax=Paenibacillus daejeonensis TaxID=135193 RepID=UPI00037EB1FF|nr:hypothetical protein [Paenibacillus daejeonensis]